MWKTGPDFEFQQHPPSLFVIHLVLCHSGNNLWVQLHQLLALSQPPLSPAQVPNVCVSGFISSCSKTRAVIKFNKTPLYQRLEKSGRKHVIMSGRPWRVPDPKFCATRQSSWVVQIFFIQWIISTYSNIQNAVMWLLYYLMEMYCKYNKDFISSKKSCLHYYLLLRIGRQATIF